MESAGIVRSRDEREDRDDSSETTSTSKRQRTSLGGQGRGAGYSPAEVAFFLTLLEEHLPVTTREWKAVVRLHNLQFPSLKRTTNSLRRKFLALGRSASGKDESSWSPEVRRAFHTKFRMKNRGDIPEEDGEEDSEDDDEQQEDEPRGNAPNRPDARAPVTLTQSQSQSQSLSQTQSQPLSQSQTQTQAPPLPPGARYYSQPSQGQLEQPSQQPRLQQMYNANGNTNIASSGAHGPSIHDRMLEAIEYHSGMPSQQQPGSGAREANLMELIKLQLLQNVEDDRSRRAEERERREVERRHWEEERVARDDYRRRYEEERARREEDLRRWEEDRAESRRRHEEFMQLILSLVNKNK